MMGFSSTCGISSISHATNFSSFHSKLLQSGADTKNHFPNFNFGTRISFSTRALQRRMPISFSQTDPTLDSHERTSPIEVKKEIEQCYQLIHRLGRGVLYIGSARPQPNHPHYVQSLELGREVANLLDCTTWSGVGPGLMDAVTRGALQAGKPVGGFKIEQEGGLWTSTGSHPYLPPDTFLTCRFFSARKHGLVDAVVRNNSSDRTAVIALPGGIGTLDEMFEILGLIQLQRIGSQLPVPFLLMNYDAYYSKLLDFIDDIERWGYLRKGEMGSLWKVFNKNEQALAYLARFYNLTSSNRSSEEH